MKISIKKHRTREGIWVVKCPVNHSEFSSGWSSDSVVHRYSFSSAISWVSRHLKEAHS